MKAIKLLTRLAGTVALPAFAILGSASSAHALGVFFEPPGADLDDDVISDLIVTPNTIQNFQFFVDAPLLNVYFNNFYAYQFEAELGYDVTEWAITQGSLNNCNTALGGSCVVTPNTVPGTPTSGSGETNKFNYTLTDTLGLLPILSATSTEYPIVLPVSGLVGPESAIVNDGAADVIGTLTSFSFATSRSLNPDGFTYTYSGIFKYMSDGSCTTGGVACAPLSTSATNAIFGTQSISMQLPTSVPGPLPIMGAGVAFGYSRRMRKRIKSSKFSIG